ncbi:MAG: glycosyltransferase family 39 protein, partial [Chloroflexota bacterium]
MTLAGVIRLYGLDAKSFWFDEFLTAHAARISNWDDLVAWWRLWIDHPPLQTWLTWLLRPLGGDEFVVRVPVALASTGAVGVMYALGATMYRPRVGVVSALMLTLSPYAVWYGQEARPYAFILLLTLLQMLFAARVARRGLLRDWTTLGAVTILALYTSYLAIATTGAVVAYLAFRAIAPTMDPSGASAAARPGPSESRLDRRSFALHGIATGVVVGLAYLPWLPFLLAFVSRPDLGFGRIDTSHRPTLDEVTALLRSVDLGDVIVVALMVAGVLVSVGAVRRGRWRSSALLGCWLGVGLGILIVRAHGGVVTIWPRYLVYLAPAGLLLAAVGVDGIATAASHFVPARRSVVTAMVVFVALTFTVLLPAPRRVGEAYTAAKGEDYRGAARLIAEGTPPGAVVLA